MVGGGAHWEVIDVLVRRARSGRRTVELVRSRCSVAGIFSLLAIQSDDTSTNLRVLWVRFWDATGVSTGRTNCWAAPERNAT
ncbi:MAG: hypothetical protein QOD56_2125 [Gammaproteobacteria bacterium]|nr:hypothetical protein [Gammaproteobacteria bacterium]